MYVFAHYFLSMLIVLNVLLHIQKMYVPVIQFCHNRFDTIGLTQFDNNLRSLAVSLIPSAVFIAVLAMQLRYFSPQSLLSSRGSQGETTSLDLVSLLPKFIRNTVEQMRDELEEDNDRKKTESGKIYDCNITFLLFN